jgi:hypothetical protein
MFLKRTSPTRRAEKEKKTAVRLSAVKKVVFGLLIFCFAGGLVLFPISQTKAFGMEIMVGDDNALDVLLQIWDEITSNEITRKGEKEKDKVVKDKTMDMIYKTVGSAAKKVAYDAATYIGSGGKGQKPLFITEGWDVYLKNIGDEAVGEFVERMGRNWDFNLCEPDFALKVKIGLGLVQKERPKPPECTFSKMLKNWDKELKSPDFLSKFQNMFDPASNDLGIALSLQTKIMEDAALKQEDGKNIRLANKGWLNVTDLDGRMNSVPFIGDVLLNKSLDSLYRGVDKITGNSLTEIINIFLNQLAVTYVSRVLQDMQVKDTTSPYSGTLEWLSSEKASPVNTGTVGIQEKLNKIFRPNFTVRGDYEILNELTQCPNPTKAGPTNCVIADNFRQAIAEKLTVGEAIEQGYLNPGGVFGFKADGAEPSYNEGYPYRSMIILRKFRILPMGWEVAGQLIKKYQGNPNIGGGKNLGELVACFDQNDEHAGYYNAWCDGLIDPNWVLKAPLNYCKRAGAGPEIVSEQITGEGKTSKLEISRNDNYCADEQSCIKENKDGSCQLYGYCAEERRKWEFEGDSCEPKYNTCQSFRTDEGNTVSYLENTLDYANCSLATAGCKWYCQNYDFNNGAWTCDAVAASDRIYLDRDAEECAAENEGCHEFIMTKPGLGANLIFNSSFEDDVDEDGIADGWVSYGPDDAIREIFNDGVSGNKAQKIVSGPTPGDGNTHGGIRMTMPFSPIVVGEKYTISFYAKKGSGSQNKIEVSNQSGLGDPSCLSFAADLTSDWQRYSKTCILDLAKSDLFISSFFPNEEFFIDAIKLERGDATNYSDYGQNGLVYEKAAPDYLNCDGIDDPAECDKFARECGVKDVGCEMYSSKRKNLSVPAKVIATDYCPAECVGYDIYVQKPATFDSIRDAYFIPETAKTCSAKALGCDEFTNLDTIARGGEEKEYYSALRQCIKSGANCDDFYTWEGSDETGYQLRVFKMQKDIDDINGNGNTTEPAVTENDLFDCDSAIYNYPSSNPAYNADCREFYNRAGQVSYHLISRTITCSDECKTFRRSEKNIDPALDVSTCQAGGDGTSQYSNTKNKQFNWDAAAGSCYYCKNGGYWSADQTACLYDAIPGEGQKCSAAESGCREYAGNTGNNMMTVKSFDFEGSMQDWAGQGTTAVSVNSNSLMVGGNSLKVSGTPFTAAVPLGSVLSQTGTYVLSFLAKGDTGPVSLTAKIDNGTGSTAFDGQADLRAGDWGVYQFNLIEFKHLIGDSENLVITGNGDFYIDDIKLTQITNKYYLVKNSWATPVSCLNDIFGNPAGALYNLGCDEYTDRENNTHYLHSFDHLCQESAVGCELMIDTHNSASYKSDAKNDDNGNGLCEASEVDCAFVPADNYAYIVYDKNKECSAEDKGCQFLGESYKYEGDVLFTDVYKKNNPDKYNSILCSASAEGCEEWFAGDGASYFKDPKDQVCDWRLKSESVGGNWGWFKKKVNRCDEDKNGSINPNNETEVCLSDRDCGAEVKCILDNYDYACPVEGYKTIGQGGLVYQPKFENNIYWAGYCPAASAGCTEYADPISVFSENEIYNESFVLDLNSDNLADGWSANNTQETAVEPDTFYVMAVNGENSLEVETLDANGALVPFDSATNDFSFTPVNSLEIAFTPDGERKSLAFITGGSTRRILVTAGNTISGKVELKKAVVEYQLEQNVDGKDCNGVVNFENGCVLFNARAQNGTEKLPLSWDADRTYNDGAGLSPAGGSAGENDANMLLKVRPDRECGQWLACRDTEKVGEETVCLGVGVCDKFNDKGGCERFVDEFSGPNNIPQSQKYPSVVSSLDNLSGYTKVGLDSNVNTNYGVNAYPYYNDYYKFGEMKTFGVSANILNWDFEDIQETDGQGAQDFGDPDIPYLGWTCDKDENGKGDYVCETIDDPVEAQDENVCFKKENKNCFIYAPAGRSFLKVMNKGDANYSVSTMPGYEINVARGEAGEGREHMFTAYINTDKISDGNAKLSIIGFEENNAPLPGTGDISRYLVERGTIKSAEFDSSKDKGWKLIAFSFTTLPNTMAIRIKLSFSSGASGSYYIDNIRIKPMLESRDYYVDNIKYIWKTQQSCQLYPLDDSLSCEYYDNSGIRYKGQYGYCLEYDRYPGSPDACLLWWPTPDGADRVNEYCGNGVPDGEEDCDCGVDVNGDVITDCFSGPLPNGSATYPLAPNPYGTHKYNQYRCSSCVWTEGWCGDGIVQSTTNSEHCDWNDANAARPNLKEQTCWSDHTQLGDKLNEIPNQAPNHYAQYDFAHDGYTDYLWGDLQCYNNSDGDDRCKFDASGCSDRLNGGSTRKNCVDQGGIVVNKNGVAVTDTAGIIINRDLVGNNSSNNNTPFFCKFGDGNSVIINISCGDDNVYDDIDAYCASKGMTRYNYWSAGRGKRCQGEDECDTSWCGYICCQDTSECNSSNYSWQNINIQPNASPACQYDDATVDDCLCGTYTQDNFPDITAVGCY